MHYTNFYKCYLLLFYKLIACTNFQLFSLMLQANLQLVCCKTVVDIVRILKAEATAISKLYHTCGITQGHIFALPTSCRSS